MESVLSGFDMPYPRPTPKAPIAHGWRLQQTPSERNWKVIPVKRYFSESLQVCVISSIEDGNCYQLRIMAERRSGTNRYMAQPCTDTCRLVLAEFGITRIRETTGRNAHLHRDFVVPVQK